MGLESSENLVVSIGSTGQIWLFRDDRGSEARNQKKIARDSCRRKVLRSSGGNVNTTSSERIAERKQCMSVRETPRSDMSSIDEQHIINRA